MPNFYRPNRKGFCGENLGERTEWEGSKGRWEINGLGERPASKSLVGVYPQDEAWWVWLLRQPSNGVLQGHMRTVIGEKHIKTP